MPGKKSRDQSRMAKLADCSGAVLRGEFMLPEAEDYKLRFQDNGSRL
jgi:hypothetical protein